jgi:aspartyl-tRNA(Asn)/glutamyl-tRNA(Gln) amidotransferase subunit C
MSQDPTQIVKKMAALARLRIEAEEEPRLAGQFASILQKFEALSELDVEGVEPMTGPLEPEDVLREDEVRPSLTPDQALSNAPDRQGNFYAVPKTVGGEA